MKYAGMIVQMAEAIEKKYGSGASDEIMDFVYRFTKRLIANWLGRYED
jgi:hypothetical protein